MSAGRLFGGLLGRGSSVSSLLACGWGGSSAVLAAGAAAAAAAPGACARSRCCPGAAAGPAPLQAAAFASTSATAWPTAAAAAAAAAQHVPAGARGYATGGRGLVPNRKPAVKKPARHQWHYCAPDYDPMLPHPSQPLPPYAPPRAHQKDYAAIFSAQMPVHHRNKFRRGWAKQTKLADEAWKAAWQRSRAQYERREAALQRRAEGLARRQAWAEWCAARDQTQGQQQQQQRQLTGQQEQPQQRTAEQAGAEGGPLQR
ncbi:hypothetical protein Rsub_05265 [Raphidocelis subcapitata]|uniref:Uncharacterized protein n=1 Tax=Raphidocelis subcapitata TaxID=307507 RepID=A0A2V0P2V1_9CHLO|nr:hypothetical protein Rsub_05265 [Raphidocelis subcapitata]|eukprot:GBF92183.1 hypothetical protein Rsub_05265 [Raphidocelis subcapitata]